MRLTTLDLPPIPHRHTRRRPLGRTVRRGAQTRLPRCRPAGGVHQGSDPGLPGPATEVRRETRKSRAESGDGFAAVVQGIGLIVAPAALTLRTVAAPARAVVQAADPSPMGYTWSLLLFLAPVAVLAAWFFRRRGLQRARRAFWPAIGILVPTGLLLDLAFGNTFFEFPNRGATLGWNVPARGGSIPVEELVFYLAGFMATLLSYIWADECFVNAYQKPNLEKRRLVGAGRPVFRGRACLPGVALVAGAVVFRGAASPGPAGFPWYFVYLVALGFVPAAGLFTFARPLINWRAFGFTLGAILLLSLVWEVTLAIPYGWWGYRPGAMMGAYIRPWNNLPLEAVFVWFSVTFTTVILYEVLKATRVSIGSPTDVRPLRPWGRSLRHVTCVVA